MIKNITLLILLMVLTTGLYVSAETVTQGTFNKLRAISEKVSTDIDHYASERDTRLKNLQRIKTDIRQMKSTYSKTRSRNQQLELQTRILSSSSELVAGYMDLYGLALEKMDKIIPDLRWMRDTASRGVSFGPAAKQIQDPVTRQQLGNLYSNLANLSLILNDKSLQGQVAPLLKANEELFKGVSASQGIYKNITGNIDRVIDHYSNLYAQTSLGYRKLQQKKQKLLIANNLMAFVIALEPLKENILDISRKGGMDVPEMDVDLDEVADLIVKDSGEPMSDNDFYIPNPDGKPDLVRYKKEGLNF